jgi:hypothetical protein
MNGHYKKDREMSETYIDELAALIRENCPRSSVKFACFERMVVTCNTEDSNDTEIELVKAGFDVTRRHPRLRTEMRLNLNRVVITAEREVAKGKA